MIIISYPFIFCLQRGNFFAFYAFIMATIAIVGLKHKFKISSAVLMAMAINIRPNLAVFIPLFYFWTGRDIKSPFSVIVLSGAFFGASAYMVNQSYPSYTLSNFVSGLETYKMMFIIGDWGFGYSISIYTLAKLAAKLFNISFESELMLKYIYGACLLMFGYTMRLFCTLKIQESGLVFILATISMLATPVFADYHLLIFVLPAMLALEEDETQQNVGSELITLNRLTFVACCVMLSPLNYVNFHGLYVASLLKIPVVLITSFILIWQNSSFSHNGVRLK
jgi:hypothetical protein